MILLPQHKKDIFSSNIKKLIDARKYIEKLKKQEEILNKNKDKTLKFRR